MAKRLIIKTPYVHGLSTGDKIRLIGAADTSIDLDVYYIKVLNNTSIALYLDARLTQPAPITSTNMSSSISTRISVINKYTITYSETPRA